MLTHNRNQGVTMQKVKLITLVAGLGALALLGSAPGLAAEASIVATANSTIVVNTTGTTTLSVTPSESILAGKYDSKIPLGTWEASTSVGSLAFRLNPATMAATGTASGTAKSKENSSNTIPVEIHTDPSYPCRFQSATAIDGWAVCNQGLSSSGGSIVLRTPGYIISPGTYPLSMDAAIWAY